MSIVFAILLFSFLIFIHELGHFIAAKLSGVQVNEFSMFMGPAIVKWQRGETQYSIRCIPIGGYCAMEGESEESDSPRSFGKAKWWKRLIILMAGSFMNLVTGVVILAIVLSCSKGYTTRQLVDIEAGSSVLSENGLQVGDEIIEVDGTKINIYEDFYLESAFMADGTYDVTVLREGQKVKLRDVAFVRQDFGDGNGYRYGISFGVKATTAGSVLKQLWPQTQYQVKTVLFSLELLLTGKAGIQDMSGPVGIVQLMSETAESADSTGTALLRLLNLGGFIAINLAVMNMLPIPALDGGRAVGLLLTTAIEKVTKKKLNPKIEGYIHSIGMVILMAFMVFILFKDVFTIIKG